MKLKLAACAAAVLLAAPVFAQTTMVPSPAPAPAVVTHSVPPGGELSVVVGPTPAAIAAANGNNTAVLGGAPATSLQQVRIDVTNSWNVPPGAANRADFQRWLRLWP